MVSKNDQEPSMIFDYCCCCIPLRIAAVIIGYLSVLECAIIAIKCLVGKEHEMVTLILLTPGEPPEQIKCHGMGALCICRALFNICMIVLCILLIHGINKGIPKFMELWMIAYLAVNLLEFILLLTALIWIGGTYLPCYFLFLLLKFYCLFIVYRYYLLLSEDCDCQDVETERYDPECADCDSQHDDSDSPRRTCCNGRDRLGPQILELGPNDCSDNDGRTDSSTEVEN